MASPLFSAYIAAVIFLVTCHAVLSQKQEIFEKDKMIPNHIVKYLISHPEVDHKVLSRFQRDIYLRHAQAKSEMDLDEMEREAAKAEFQESVKAPLVKYKGSAESEEEEKHIVEERTPETNPTTTNMEHADSQEKDEEKNHIVEERTPKRKTTNHHHVEHDDSEEKKEEDGEKPMGDEETPKEETTNHHHVEHDDSEENEKKEEEKEKTTVKPKMSSPLTDPKIARYTTKIHQAFKGWGADHQTFIDIVADTDYIERLNIGSEYRRQYGKSLVKELEKELKNRDFGNLIIGMFLPKHAFLAKELHNAIHGLGTDEVTLNEILCCQTVDMLGIVKHEYKYSFKKDLVNDLKGDTSGMYERLLVKLTENNRHEEEMDDNTFDDRVATALRKLNPGLPAHLQPTTKKPKRNEKKKGKASEPKETDFLFDKAAFIEVFSSYSNQVIAQVAIEFENKLGFELQETIRAATSEDFQKLLLNILHFSQNKTEFYARTIHAGFDASNIFAFNRKPLTRALVMLETHQLNQLQRVYNHIFQRGLHHSLQESMKKSHYKTAVTTLLDNSRVDK
ncbi:Annexin B9 [Orchesella cincta]|uniref:Annexin B9 n=1 Tax=Orchesella cincta TaxID=48709 RepID=A0A1D2N7N4_ORCCI|nr:Annexin B9 [Orchesella cincta]